MKDTQQWAEGSALDAARAVVRAFAGAVEARAGAAHPALRDAIEDERERLEQSHRAWVVDEAAAANLHMLAAVLAAHRALAGRLSDEELLPLLRECFSGQFRDVVREGTARWLDGVDDPFREMVALSKSRERHSFGAGFRFEHERDDDRAYLLNVRGCFYHDFFAANGAPQLTPLFCDFDLGWIEAIDPARHGLRFERATTIGYGGAMCPFHFFRVEPRGPREGG